MPTTTPPSGHMENVPSHAFAEQKARTCTKCAYFNGARLTEHAKCGHPCFGGSIDPVFGFVIAIESATQMRSEGGACGPAGRLFVDYSKPQLGK